MPVTNAEALEARNWYAPVRSAGVPQRRCAVCAVMAAESSGLLFQPFARGESNHPGATTLTVMPEGTRSKERPLARPTNPALDVLYAVRPRCGRSARTEPVKISRPPVPMARAA